MTGCRVRARGRHDALLRLAHRGEGLPARVAAMTPETRAWTPWSYAYRYANYWWNVNAKRRCLWCGIDQSRHRRNRLLGGVKG